MNHAYARGGKISDLVNTVSLLKTENQTFTKQRNNKETDIFNIKLFGQIARKNYRRA